MRAAPLPVTDLAAHADALRRDPQGVNPAGWRVDWADGPWPVKVYADAARTPLGRDGALDRLLLFTFGMTAVRFDPSGGMPSTPGNPHPTHLGERYSPRRTIPSGGAMYPTEAYLVDGSRIAHYDPYRHELVDLAGAGTAFDEPALVLTLRYWKNAYKYGEFAARLAPVDAGVALGRALRLAEAAFDHAAVRADFDGAALAELLGLDDAEDVVAVVELGRAAPRPQARAVRTRVLEKSAATRRLPMLERLRADAQTPAESTEDHAVGVRGPLDLLDQGAMVRRGSHGRRFTGAPVPLAAADAVLRHAAEALARVGALGGGLGLCCAVSRVEGVEPGWYRFDGGLRRVTAGEPGPVVQRALFAESLNPELAAFTVHVTGPVDFPGARGYRDRQLGVGAAVEAVCLAATAVGLSGHAVLGFDVGPIDRAYDLFPDRGAHAQVCVGAARPSPNWEVAVVPR